MRSKWKITAALVIVAAYVAAGFSLIPNRSEAQDGPGPIFEFIAQGTANVSANTKYTKGPTTVLLEKATIPVGGAVPWHCHPGPTTFIVVQGVLTTFDADGTSHVLVAGDADVEQVGAARTSENLGTEDVVVYIQFAPPEGLEGTIWLDGPDDKCEY